MGLYSERCLPHLLNLAMKHRDLAVYRQRVVPAARGRVLEIGIGSGLNVPFYGSGVDEVTGLEPSPRLLAMAERQAKNTHAPLVMIQGSAEAIPLDDSSFDTIVTTWTLCSIANVRAALAEMRRVLKPTGELLFVEHGKAPDQAVRWVQDQLNPFWKPIAGGCHLNRKIDNLISDAGFEITNLQCGYMRGPRPFTFMYEGRAVRR